MEALSANGNVDLLEKQARKFKPSVIAVFREDAAKELKERLKDMNIRIVTGMDGLIEIATLPETDILVTAIVGMIGILDVYKRQTEKAIPSTFRESNFSIRRGW